MLVWDGTEVSTPSLDDVPSGRRVILRMAATALVVLVLVALGGVVAASRLAERDAIHSGADIVGLLADAVVQPHVTDAVVAGDPAALAELDAAVRRGVLPRDIVRVKLWTPSGVIVYSDEPQLIGQSFPLDPEKRAALAHPSTRAVVTDSVGPENRFEKDMGKLLEAYRPVWTSSGTELLFEVYSKYEPVAERTEQLWRAIAGLLATTLILFGVLLAPVLWRLVSQLRHAAAQREVLLRKTVTASEDERRRIAGSLHDGPVQELVATSYAVSRVASLAAADGRTDLAAQIREAVGTVRSTVGSLRSLLVDLYPPSLDRAGLSSALSDLADGVRARGLRVQVDLDPGALALLDDSDERHLYRVTQEALRNVVSHAQATAVEISVRRGVADGAVVLDIADDGVGFDAAAVLDSPPQGHLGLRVLRDQAAEAHGRLEVTTAPGCGTRWSLTLFNRTEKPV